MKHMKGDAPAFRLVSFSLKSVQYNGGLLPNIILLAQCYYHRGTHLNAINGRSLSGMGLTRERWCCARGWLSKLDMNTCQTSIKTGIIL